jgi:SAM-dependent methyltransferase
MTRPAPDAWRAWERDWTAASTAEVETLDAPSLGNHIDELKIAFLARDLPRAGRALEVGCGSARLLARVGTAAPLELVALDPAPSALGLAWRTAERTRVEMERVRGDALGLPFRDGSFDLVLSGGLLEHFRDPEPVLAEMVRVLRPGGTFYADVVPRRFSLYRLPELPRIVRTPWLLPGVFEASHGPGLYRRALTALGCHEPRIRWAGVYPPRANRAMARRLAVLDGSPLAGLLGWYFMIVTRRVAAGRGVGPAPSL